MKFDLTAIHVRLCRWSAAFCLGWAVMGCAHPPETLVLHPDHSSGAVTEPFASAYASRDASGNTDIVLVDKAAQQSLEGRQAEGPVRQIMHVRVLWLPARDLKADHRSASNATIHWYILGNAPDRSADILEYAGTGFVVAESDGTGVNLTIRTANLKPVACRGRLCDPVGPATLDGTIHATDNRRKVRAALTNVRAAVTAASGMTEHFSAAHAKPESPSSSAR